jgi:hypothetical protein
MNPAVLETLQTYVLRKTLSTCTSHSISTCFPHAEAVQDGATWGAQKLIPARNGMAFRFDIAKTPISRRTPKRKTEN